MIGILGRELRGRDPEAWPLLHALEDKNIHQKSGSSAPPEERRQPAWDTTQSKRFRSRSAYWPSRFLIALSIAPGSRSRRDPGPQHIQSHGCNHLGLPRPLARRFRLVAIRRLAPSRGSPEKVMANSFAKRRYARRVVGLMVVSVWILPRDLGPQHIQSHGWLSPLPAATDAPWAVVGPSSRSNEGRVHIHFP